MSGLYSDLKSAVQRECLNRTDLATEIAAAINSAILHYQRKKFWFSEEHVTSATVANQAYITVPSDIGYVDGITVIYSANGYPIPVVQRDAQTMRELSFNTTILTGTPTDWAYIENKIFFWPTPNAVYTVTIWQNFKNAAPVNDVDTNNWTTDAEELIRSRAVADVMCNILKDQTALAEYGQVGALGFMSGRERIAFQSLEAETVHRISSHRVKPIDF